MENYTLTETMKVWLKDLYLDKANEFRGSAKNSHLMALGSDEQEDAVQFERYADEQREFARILEVMAKEINIE